MKYRPQRPGDRRDRARGAARHVLLPGALDLPAFAGLIFQAARQAERRSALETMGASHDHPQRPDRPPRYLKVCSSRSTDAGPAASDSLGGETRKGGRRPSICTPQAPSFGMPEREGADFPSTRARPGRPLPRLPRRPHREPRPSLTSPRTCVEFDDARYAAPAAARAAAGPQAGGREEARAAWCPRPRSTRRRCWAPIARRTPPSSSAPPCGRRQPGELPSRSTPPARRLVR